MDITEKMLQLKQDFDDVYEAGKDSVYETITITSDIANSYQLTLALKDLKKDGELIIMYCRKDFIKKPNELNYARGTALYYVWLSVPIRDGSTYSGNLTMRYIDGAYNPTIVVDSNYTAIAEAGTEFVKVVIL